MKVEKEQLGEFFKKVVAKNKSIEGINALLTSSCEHEVGMGNDEDQVRYSMQYKTNPATYRRGFASNFQTDDGNGWNNDLHSDGFFINEDGNTSRTRRINGREYNRLEISQSPIQSTNYGSMVCEVNARMGLLRESAHSMVHMCGGSTHFHNTLTYFKKDAERWGESPEILNVLDVPIQKMYQQIANFMIRFMPVMKWISMTCPRGARGAHGNQYDKLDGDQLFQWFDRVEDANEHNSYTDTFLQQMRKESYLRIYSTDSFHWENRMMDCAISPTLLSAWAVLNRAISLFAYDMVSNGIDFKVSNQEMRDSEFQAGKHRIGWKEVDRDYINKEYIVMKSYLAKYFKKANSLDALDILDKLIECPIPEYLEKNKIPFTYNLEIVEKMFAERTRLKDETTRNSYLHAIKAMTVPVADNLNMFHENVATELKIQSKQAISLYQMFKRENVDIEFLAGRLVYMGN
jgi:hypothetical protein